MSSSGLTRRSIEKRSQYIIRISVLLDSRFRGNDKREKSELNKVIEKNMNDRIALFPTPSPIPQRGPNRNPLVHLGTPEYYFRTHFPSFISRLGHRAHSVASALNSVQSSQERQISLLILNCPSAHGITHFPSSVILRLEHFAHSDAEAVAGEL